MSYIDKYVTNIKPSDLKLSFWGGDAVLRNLELRLDVLERELRIPLEIKSGCIRELTLHLPWNAIGSSPVEVTIKDLEFVVKLKSLRMTSSDSLASYMSLPEVRMDNSDDSVSQSEAEDVEPAPGYMQGYLNRIINNVSVHIQNMVVKVMEEESDLMLTLNIDSMDFHTTSDKWKREFIYTDYFQDKYTIHKLLEVSGMAVNLHPIEMREKAQGSLLHEPFVNRCSLVCQMRFEYQGKVVTRRTFDVLVEPVEISADERQFCLFLHLLDWLAAMYYSSKKLKGRDDRPVVVNPEPQGHGKVVVGVGSSHNPGIISSGSESDVDNPDLEPKTGNATDVSLAQNETLMTGDAGWGSWLRSFVTSSEGEAELAKLGQGQTEEGGGMAAKELYQPETRFTIACKSVMVLLKMTQQVQVPVFTRFFTSPVMSVSFSRCFICMDKSPVTKQFVVCVGVGAVKADVMGLCPCAKKFPSSWRRASVASATDTSKLV